MLNGVIEGFYGRGWSALERRTLMDWMATAGMNTFVYAPKDDVHARARWRHLYSTGDLEGLRELNNEAAARGILLFVAIAPCLDIAYSDPAEIELLIARFDQLLGAGIKGFALLFDDIPNVLPEADRARFSSFAEAQAFVANAAFEQINAAGGQMLFCPTEYCTRFAGGDVTKSPYLETLGNQLAEGIEVFWTGPEVVSPQISAASLEEIGRVLKRKPVIWENFHANDYDLRRVIAGPLGGRDRNILQHVDGFITNPNNELLANFVPIHTTGQFLAGPDYDEASALDNAISDWRPQFELSFSENGETLSGEQIGLLVELFYQPFELGPRVALTLSQCRAALSVSRPDPGDAKWRGALHAVRKLSADIEALHVATTEMQNRDLFHTFNPYLLEAREEFSHLTQYLNWLDTGPAAEEVFPADQFQNFYRRGPGVAVQEILKRDPAG
ncbi:MAG: beta-N-acetylglucosaminidase domain-containing protein, partial [Hyphomicrobiaceae bacterium]|nr:beta-N-acetylglucosaminidase domain-containing protein [Hyphomicrobiaceae bacterium]